MCPRLQSRHNILHSHHIYSRDALLHKKTKLCKVRFGLYSDKNNVLFYWCAFIKRAMHNFEDQLFDNCPERCWLQYSLFFFLHFCSDLRVLVAFHLLQECSFVKNKCARNSQSDHRFSKIQHDWGCNVTFHYVAHHIWRLAELKIKELSSFEKNDVMRKLVLESKTLKRAQIGKCTGHFQNRPYPS